MPKAKQKHIHKYGKVIPNKDNPDWVIYKCHLPGCSHYQHGDFVLGKESLCWLCGKAFIMGPRHLLRKPECNICKGIEVEVTANVPDVSAILDEVLKEIK